MASVQEPVKLMVEEGAQEPIAFGKPWIDDADRGAVSEALRSDWILNGPRVRDFEVALRDYTGAKSAVAVASCTAGMHVALSALGVGASDEVIVPAFSFAANGLAVLQTGAVPRFVDVDEATQNIDPGRIEGALSRRTRAILVVHYAGLCADMDPILDIAERHGLAVVEDAAHALGARYRGRMVGALGSATVFSFGPLKMIVTAGMGGMVTVRGQVVADRLRRLVSYGMDKSMWDRKADRRPWEYGIGVLGHNFRMTDPAAAMGLTQMAKLDRILSRRRELAAIYAEELGGVDGIVLPPDPSDQKRAYLYYVVRVDQRRFGITRDELAMHLHANGVGISVHWDPPLHRHQLYRDFAGGDSFHVSDRLAHEVLSLPLHPRLTEAEVRRVGGLIRACST